MRVVGAIVLSLAAGSLCRLIFPHGWANFFGAIFVASGGFLLATAVDRKDPISDGWGLAFATFGGVLIMVDAFPLPYFFEG